LKNFFLGVQLITSVRAPPNPTNIEKPQNKIRHRLQSFFLRKIRVKRCFLSRLATVFLQTFVPELKVPPANTPLTFSLPTRCGNKGDRRRGMLKLEWFRGGEVRLYHEGIKGIFGGRKLEKGSMCLYLLTYRMGSSVMLVFVDFSRYRRKPRRIQLERSSMHILTKDME